MQIMMHLMGLDVGEGKTPLPPAETEGEEGDFADLLGELVGAEAAEWPEVLVSDMPSKPLAQSESNIMQSALGIGFPLAMAEVRMGDAPPRDVEATEPDRAASAVPKAIQPDPQVTIPAGPAPLAPVASKPAVTSEAEIVAPAQAPVAKSDKDDASLGDVPRPLQKIPVDPLQALPTRASDLVARPVGERPRVEPKGPAETKPGDTSNRPTDKSEQADRAFATGKTAGQVARPEIPVMRRFEDLPEPKPNPRSAVDVILPSAATGAAVSASPSVLIATQVGADPKRAEVSRIDGATLKVSPDSVGEIDATRTMPDATVEPEAREAKAAAEPPIQREEGRARQRAEFPAPAFAPPPDRTSVPSAAAPQIPAPMPAIAARESESAHVVNDSVDLPLTHAADPIETRRSSEPGGPRVSETPVRPVVAQIVQALKAGGDSVVEVRLSPEELGRVRLSMTPADTGMTVHVATERPETLDLLRRNIDVLANDLERQGFSDLNFSFRQEREPPQPRPNRGGFGGEIPMPDAPSGGIAPLSARHRVAADGHIDIRL